jgi:hypothetical protein
MPEYFADSPKIALGFQEMSLANSTAVTLNSTTNKARALLVTVETNNVRIRFGDTAPTLNTGVLLPKDDTYWIPFYDGGGLSFQRSTGTAKVTVQAFKNKGDNDR